MISVDDALARILAAVTPLPAETLPLANAAGRTLAAEVTAQLDNPAFDVSAMDGYAVRAGDFSPGAVRCLVGMSQAGAGFNGAVGRGECARIFTGAPVPAGADTVIMQEETEAAGDAITFHVAARRGHSIRYRGADFSRGGVLARAGDPLTPRRLALLAAGNNATLPVSTLPRIALIATGDELVPPGSPVGPDQIVSSNSAGLAALLAPFGASVADHGIVRDDRAALAASLKAALEAEPDVLITTGGASVGEHDLVREMLLANGVEIDFWRIAMRPGKPLMFGRRGKTLVFGLPGNPVSALVTAFVFVLPALRAMTGASGPAPFFLPLAAPLPANGVRRHFIRGRFVTGPEGATHIDPVAETDSGHLSSLASADALIVHMEHSLAKTAGQIVQVHTF